LAEKIFEEYPDKKLLDILFGKIGDAIAYTENDKLKGQFKRWKSEYLQRKEKMKKMKKNHFSFLHVDDFGAICLAWNRHKRRKREIFPMPSM
jgi:hypothetical protein